MSYIYDNYSHIKCDDPGCTGDVRLDEERGYICHKCGKDVGHRYVESCRDSFFFINNMTGWIFPMIKKEVLE